MKRITSINELEALYAKPAATSLEKVTKRLTPAYQQLLQASPFCTIATSGPEGLDCSPRGDAADLIRVIDDHTLALPDRRGNNRLDTLRNIVRCPSIALLFLIPGVNETLKINGNAWLTNDKKLLESFSVNGKAPATVIVIDIQEIYFQCARALVRSRLWDPDTQVARQTLPTAGQMIKSVISEFDDKSYDSALPSRQKDTLY